MLWAGARFTVVMTVDDHSAGCFLRAGSGGLIDPGWCSASFVEVMAALPEDLAEAEVARPELLLAARGRVEVFFTPFDWVNRSARVAIVGVTPGRFQAHQAVMTAARQLRAGASLDAALAEADRVGSFAGAMRVNLIAMLDGIGLAGLLGLDSTARMFTDRADLVASTSVVCHPVFIAGANYTGSAPKLGQEPLLRAFATQVLAANLAAVPEALVVPLGRAAEIGVGLSGVNPRRVVAGFPHPSGANGHRVRHYTVARAQLTRTAADWFTRA